MNTNNNSMAGGAGGMASGATNGIANGGANNSYLQENMMRKMQENQNKENDKNMVSIAFARVFEQFISRSENEIQSTRIHSEELQLITNYYEKYYTNSVSKTGFLFSIFAFLSSFFGFVGFVFIALFYMKIIASHKFAYFYYFTKNIDIDKRYTGIIYDKIFPNSLKMKALFIIGFLFFIFSLLAYFFPIHFSFFDAIYENRIFEIMQEKLGLNLDYFLFAILNFLHIFSILLVKEYERWRFHV
ncbi:MAG: hypothetical protein GQ570_15540 [Helicobacteraceae bacterium]|nr:hypothetical protein [Helicobacteraceae bacterium]